MNANFKKWTREERSDELALLMKRAQNNAGIFRTDFVKQQSLWKRSSRGDQNLSQQIFAAEHLVLDEVIEDSKFILTAQSCDDNDGYSLDTWKRTTNYLRRLALHADMKNLDFPLPRIVPADGGSIDLLWKSGSRGLLINFPADGDHATYYGKKTDIQISGVLFSDDAHDDLIRWLTE